MSLSLFGPLASRVFEHLLRNILLPPIHQPIPLDKRKMRTAGAFTVLLLALIFSASCVAPLELVPPTAEINVTRQPAAAATPTIPPTATPTQLPTATPEPNSQNAALLGTVRAHLGEETAQNAIDGDLDTIWNSTDFPAMWIAVALDDLYLVEKVELVVAQAPAGPTTHVLWVDNGSEVRTLFKRFADVHTEDGQTLTIEFNPPSPIKEVLIQTLQSPSWVAWREVRILGTPLSPQNEGEKPPPLRLEKFLDGLELPVQVTHAGDGSGRIFVVEQNGRIKIFQNGVANDVLFLDISDQVSCCGELGLMNIVFPPSFKASQQFYLSYTNLDREIVVSRFSTTNNGATADPASEEILLAVSQPHHAHNGGSLAFGPQDGYLYVGIGDGGSEGRPAHFPQDPQLLLGKILRIDVESGADPYAIPATNPFIGDDGFRDEIWALGLRNPWGFAFDAQTGELYIPDTGHNDREEVNFQPATSVGGENYGWPTIEGTRCPKIEDLPYPCSQAGIFESPVAEFDHISHCAIVGGVVYRGAELPHLSGRFIYADFCRGVIWSLKKPEAEEATGSKQAVQGEWLNEVVLYSSVPVSSIGEDEEGNLYFTGYADGTIYLISPGQSE